jgi:hypothetical protein
MNESNRWFQASVVFIISVIVFLFGLYYFPVVSHDGVVYLTAAKAYLANGLHGAMGVYNWPFYSVVIADTHIITSLNLLHSAYLLNFIALFLMFWLFVYFVEVITKRKNLFWYALIIVLSFHYLLVLSHTVIRDNVYYVFYLLSMILFLKNLEKPSWVVSLLWALITIFSMLFRIEGAIFLVIMPFVVFFYQGNLAQRCYRFIQLYAINIIIAIFLGIYLYSHYRTGAHDLGRFNQVISQFTHGVNDAYSRLSTAIEQTRQHVLSPIYAADSGVVFLSGLFFSYFFTLANLLGLAFIILIVYAWGRRASKLQYAPRWTLWGYIVLNFVITMLYLFQQLFVTERYLMGMAFSLLVFAVLALSTLSKEWKLKAFTSEWMRWIYYLMVILLAINIVSIVIHFGPSKRYIYRSTQWIKQNTKPSDKIYSNLGTMPYYSSRNVVGWRCLVFNKSIYHLTKENKANCFDWSALQNKPWKASNYLVLNIKNKKEANAVLTVMKQKPLQIFKSNRKKQVFIFQLR